MIFWINILVIMLLFTYTIVNWYVSGLCPSHPAWYLFYSNVHLHSTTLLLNKIYMFLDIYYLNSNQMSSIKFLKFKLA